MYRTRNDSNTRSYKKIRFKKCNSTWDALITPKVNIKAVISKGRDFCTTLKANQEKFYKDVQDYFDEDKLLILESGYESVYQLTREKKS